MLLDACFFNKVITMDTSPENTQSLLCRKILLPLTTEQLLIFLLETTPRAAL